MHDTPADPLATLLPSATDSDRPWLVWYAPGERVELTGRVLHMWQCKIANLLVEEVIGNDPGAGPLVHLGLGVHWRTMTWCGGVWLTGGTVLFRSSAETDRPTPATPGPPRPVDVSVAFTHSGLDANAQLQVLVPREPLAVRWPESLPPLVLDGVADVMTRADSFPSLRIDGHRAAVLEGAETRPRKLPGDSAELSRDALAAGTVDSPPKAGSAGPAPVHPGIESSDLRGAGRAVMVRADSPLGAVRGVLAAWRTGLTAVLISQDSDAELVRAACRQEGATAHRPGPPSPPPQRQACAHRHR
ncbi:TIGR03089 family protein [Actinomyces sp.]|uniref:TIGR03089 family protein n=1 Tax=Actinomyces sp. TaxID=29317 RepID=UPI0026DB8E0E|nr:TIGR03089 family protein [Actinomyces sp.]MDO4899395.1 TIGR03089 family protein [Actinomyces sp.]